MLDIPGMSAIETKTNETGQQVPRSARFREAAKLLNVGTSTLWRYAATDPTFPRPRRLSARCTLLDIPELLAWRDSKIVPPLDAINTPAPPTAPALTEPAVPHKLPAPKRLPKSAQAP